MARSYNRTAAGGNSDVIDFPVGQGFGELQGGADGSAARMGPKRTTLLARMKRLGIDPRKFA
jgi:hypothetical protein